MFSSKQDLVDLIFILPLGIIAIGVIYIFNLKIEYLLRNKQMIVGLASFARTANGFLLFSLIINVFLIVLLKSLRFMITKR